MLFELDTDIMGVTFLLEAMYKINKHDAARDPEIARALVQRCTSKPKKGFLYTPDLPKVDRWSTFVPMLRRTKANGPIKADCEDQSSSYAAAADLLLPPEAVIELSITQPAEGMMAHAYLWIDGKPYDPSAINGMRRPPEEFYGSGETARIVLTRSIVK